MSKPGKVINQPFHALLRECRDSYGDRYTVGKLADAINSSRPHVNRVLLNYERTRHQQFGSSYGTITRRKLIKFFKTDFPKQAAALLAALGWDETGKIVPRGENHVEQQL